MAIDISVAPSDGYFVPDLLTPLTEAQACFYLQQAWKNIFGAEPLDTCLAILFAQSALETGRWKSIHNHNWGNIKKISGQPYTSFKCSEIINGHNLWFFPYHPQTFFSAWNSPLVGAEAYIRFVSQRTRYQAAWIELTKGNPVKYCAALKQAGYFTDDLASYTKGVVSLTTEFQQHKIEWLSWKPEEMPRSEIEVLPPEPSTIPETINDSSEPIAQSLWQRMLQKILK